MRLRDDDSGLGKRVRLLRSGLGLSQSQLAGLCRLSRTSIANIEGGRQVPTVHTLRYLAEALGTTAGVLIGTEPMPGGTRLPEVRVVSLHSVVCAECGQVAGPFDDPGRAEQERVRHHVPHPIT